MELDIVSSGEYTDIFVGSRKANFYCIKFTVERFIDTNRAGSKIRDNWKSVLEQENIALVIDLGSIKQPISLLAGVLFWAFEELASNNSSIAIYNMKPSTEKMLKMCGIDKMIPFAKTFQQARNIAIAAEPSAQKTFWDIFKRKA